MYATLKSMLLGPPRTPAGTRSSNGSDRHRGGLTTSSTAFTTGAFCFVHGDQINGGSGNFPSPADEEDGGVV